MCRPDRLALLAAAVCLSGCVAAEVPVVAPAAVSAGGDLVKAGTAHSFGGAVFRTFSVPLPELYDATRQTLARLGFEPAEEKRDEDRVSLRAHAVDRTVRIDLQPVTPGLSQMRVFVRKATFGKDPATASEVVTQTENVLADAARPAALNARGARGSEGAASPRARR